ncbi:MAG: hypothetical protein ABI690_00265 [Chloroflexota bacterium]
MEQDIQQYNNPEVKIHPQSLKWSSASRILLMILVGFAGMAVASRGAAQSIPALPPTNPFMEYADIFPGQPVIALKTRIFSCRLPPESLRDSTTHRNPIQNSCIFTPIKGAFSSIEAKFFGDTIDKLIFTVRENRLRVGDLERILETPPIHIFDREVYFVSPKNLITVKTVAFNGQFSLFLPVWSIAFTR